MHGRIRIPFLMAVSLLTTVRLFGQTAPQGEPIQFQPATPAARTAPTTLSSPAGTSTQVIQPPTPAFPTPAMPSPTSSGTFHSAPSPTPMQPIGTTMSASANTTSGQATLAVRQVLPDTVIPGQAVAAEVTVANTGSKTAENVVLTGWWTNGYMLSEASIVAQTVNGRSAWGLGAIAAGETRTLKVKLAPQPGVTITEFRSGFDATFSSASDTRSVKVLKPEMQLQLVAPEVGFVGQPVALQLRIKNPTSMPLANINIRSQLPDTLMHPRGNNLESELPVLQAGATEVIPLDLTAVKAGEGRVRVRIAAPACETVEQEVRLLAMEARVAVTMNGPHSLYQNWPATYEATIENQGDQPIRSATYEVKLPTGFTDLRASDKPGYDSASHRIVWKFDILQPSEKKTVIWFGFGKQADDLISTGTVTVSGSPLKRVEWVTKNLGAESK